MVAHIIWLNFTYGVGGGGGRERLNLITYMKV